MICRTVLFSFLSLFFALSAVAEEDKTVLLAILARDKEHTLDKFFNCIDDLDYDKKLITVYINTNNNVDNTEEVLRQWVKRNENSYGDVIFVSHEGDSKAVADTAHHWHAERFKLLAKIRNESMQKAKELGCDYYFVVDCDNFIIPSTLKALVNKRLPIVAPLLHEIPRLNNGYYSNFFGDVNKYGYYKKHPDYTKMVDRKMVGTFKVPVVHCTYLIDTSYIDKLSYVDGSDDYEFVIFSREARRNNVDQYICNEEKFGVLLHHYDKDVSLEKEKKIVNNYFSKYTIQGEELRTEL